jgi:hypothetical protein
MMAFLEQNGATIAAFLSFLATVAAVIATWRGPRSAAELAERMREKSERDGEDRRMKIQVFSTLLQERATIHSPESVRMLNSIDFVFSKSPKVRDAWADLYSIFQTDVGPHPQLRDEKIRVLLKEMAADLGLSDTLKVDDLGRTYYPNAIAREHELHDLQREQALSRMRAMGQQPDTTPDFWKKFPEKPT